MININPTARDFADAALANYYATDIRNADDLIRYADALDSAPDATLRDRLIAAIDLDINDALHNNNLDFFYPLAELDALTNADFELLADRLLDLADAFPLIADALINLHLDPTHDNFNE